MKKLLEALDGNEKLVAFIAGITLHPGFNWILSVLRP